jgi:hypothetical protein
MTEYRTHKYKLGEFTREFSRPRRHVRGLLMRYTLVVRGEDGRSTKHEGYFDRLRAAVQWASELTPHLAAFHRKLRGHDATPKRYGLRLPGK